MTEYWNLALIQTLRKFLELTSTRKQGPPHCQLLGEQLLCNRRWETFNPLNILIKIRRGRSSTIFGTLSLTTSVLWWQQIDSTEISKFLPRGQFQFITSIITNLHYQFFASITKFTQTIILQLSNTFHNKSQPAEVFQNTWRLGVAKYDIVVIRCLGVERKRILSHW